MARRDSCFSRTVGWQREARRSRDFLAIASLAGPPIGGLHVDSRRSASLAMKAARSRLGEFRFDAIRSTINLEKVVLLARGEMTQVSKRSAQAAAAAAFDGGG